MLKISNSSIGSHLCQLGYTSCFMWFLLKKRTISLLKYNENVSSDQLKATIDKKYLATKFFWKSAKGIPLPSDKKGKLLLMKLYGR